MAVATEWKSAAGSVATVQTSGSWSCAFDWLEEGCEPGTLLDVRMDGEECWMYVSEPDGGVREIQMFKYSAQ